MLIMIDTEFTALASPVSLFRSAVNAGAAEDMGAKARIARVWRYSSGMGSRKYITIEKTFEGKRPRTLCCITPVGRAAFEAYVEVLKKYLHL